MASQTAICNLALSRLGTKATIASIDESSVEAREAKRHWDIAVDATLRGHDWNFARRRVALADMGSPPADWGYRYSLPRDCIRALEILAPYAVGVRIPFEVAGDQDTSRSSILVLLTNQPQAWLKYTARVTSTEVFDPDFATALSWRLAAEMALPLTGKADIATAMMTAYGNLLGQARATNANEGASPTADPDASWVTARGGYSAWERSGYCWPGPA